MSRYDVEEFIFFKEYLRIQCLATTLRSGCKDVTLT
jgi:hypothetical protein